MQSLCSTGHRISSTTIVPSNPMGVVGQPTTLKCPVYENHNLYQYHYGSQYYPTWTIEYATDHETCSINGAGSATGGGCGRQSYSVQFKQENLNGFQRVSTFTIPSTNLSDAGTYTCTFYNQNNQQQTTRTVLSVFGNASFVEVYKQVFCDALSGDRGVLDVDACRTIMVMRYIRSLLSRTYKCRSNSNNKAFSWNKW